VRRRGRLLICDLRAGTRARVTVLDTVDRALYEACDAVAHVNRLAAIAGVDGAPAGDAAVRARLQPLVDRGLLVTDGSRYLALALALDEYRPRPAMLARIRAAINLSRQQDRSAKEQRCQRRRPERKRQRRRRPPRSARRAGRSPR